LEKKHITRSPTIIWAINTTYKDTKEKLESTLVVFEEVYDVEAKLSMERMATIVQNLGLVMRKKSRGKSKQPQ
jgi:GTPase involved in cell partitioning and DNA repair